MRSPARFVSGLAVVGLSLTACSGAPPADPRLDSTVAPEGIVAPLGPLERALPVLPADVRVVLKRPRCELANPAGKRGVWRVDSPFPGAPAAIRRMYCSYLWIPAEEGAPPDTALLELTRTEQQVLHLATLHCALGECEAPEIDTEEAGGKRVEVGVGTRGGGGGCPACGTSHRGQSFFIYLHHPISGERVALLRRGPLGAVEDLGTITVPDHQAFVVRLREALRAEDQDGTDATKLSTVCLAPLHGDVRPTECP